MDNNIFDLSKLIPDQKTYQKHESVVYSDNDIKKMLEGYVDVPCEKWPILKNRTHIRYKRKDGSFRRGGFILYQWIGTNELEGKRFIQLSNHPYRSPSSHNWRVSYDDLDCIWKKETNEEIYINDINKQVNTINLEMNCIKKDIERLKEDQKKIIELIKKLHSTT